MGYKIQEVEGIGSAYGQRLQDAGLTTTDE